MTFKLDEIELRIEEVIDENTAIRNKLKKTQEEFKDNDMNFKAASKALYETTEVLAKTRTSESSLASRLKVAEAVIEETYNQNTHV